MRNVTVEDCISHARRFGTEAVFETAVQDGLDRQALDRLAVELRAVDRGWRAPAGWRVAAAAPAATGDRRVCAWCGGPVAGRQDRRTCSDRCRRAASRAVKSADMGGTAEIAA